MDKESRSVREHSSVEMPVSPSFEELVAEYKNTAEHNDHLFRSMTALIWKEPCLSIHRSYLEENKLGYGDAAFHAMRLRFGH
jgi:hypothetical protein